jgi:hypothetical protein
MLNGKTALFITVLLLLVPGCSNRSTNLGEEPYETGFVDDPMVLALSDMIAPSGIEGTVFIFDVSGDSLVQAGRANDLDLFYAGIPSCAEEDVWIFNKVTRGWDQIAFEGPKPPGCTGLTVPQHHLLSAQGFDIGDYIDAGNRVRVKGEIQYIRIRTVHMNPDHHTIPLPEEGALSFSGLSYNHPNLFLYSNATQSIYRMTRSGRSRGVIDAPALCQPMLACDAAGIWMVGSCGRSREIVHVSYSGRLLCSFAYPYPYNSPVGIESGGESLWLRIQDWSVLSQRDIPLLEIQPGLSCVPRDAAVLDTVQVDPCYGNGIAWDGTHFLLNTACGLYRIGRDGAVDALYQLPVYNVSDIAWDGEAVWVLHRGPKELDLPCRRTMLSRFFLR